MKVPVRDQLNRVIGDRWAAVCDPTVAYRPRCKALMAIFEHKVECALCAVGNPPGTEDNYRVRAVGQGGNTAGKPPPGGPLIL